MLRLNKIREQNEGHPPVTKRLPKEKEKNQDTRLMTVNQMTINGMFEIGNQKKKNSQFESINGFTEELKKILNYPIQIMNKSCQKVHHHYFEYTIFQIGNTSCSGRCQL